MNTPVKLEPVTLTVDLNCPVEHAFDTYSGKMGAWWPLDSHAVETDKATNCIIETREGGRIYEVTSEGKEHLWGTVLECRRPDLLIHSWHPGGDPEKPTRVQIRFEPVGKGCRLSLTHEGFEILGERGPSVRDNYGPGWQHVIGACFKGLADD